MDEATKADADGARGAASGGTEGRAEGGEADARTAEAAHRDATALRTTGPARERTSQGSRTRTLILETALRLFQERGYDKTTMRAIAQEAGVSVGNAYYYYASKEHLIQGFYDRIAAEHAAAVTDVLARERDLAGRLRGVLLTWLDIAAPYHRFAAQFFKNAADPDSPLSPFSDASEGPREAAIALHRQVLAGADTKADPELAAALPRLLWLQQMGLVLYWVHDRSENCERSRRLVERTSPLVARAVAASRFRVLRPLVREVTDVLSEFVLPAAAGAAARPRSDRSHPDRPDSGQG
ncbi:TetR family transcriptional regulator [Streptomyces griseoflavus]|uniref:TetR/AcrR family transcriptional regulator n=1 Tax=Streptomyces rimosus TaxID=1927 RepID=UPI00067D6110|nr:TetR family transcriptional regulator [Streptomyces rimosus]KOG64916.1 TetR family transcriptional regulator [Streptomyces griseoflavus]